MNWVDKLIDKYNTDSTDNTDNSNSINNKQSVNSVDKRKIVFYASLEGTNQKIPYTYKELIHIFREGFTESRLIFIHEAKKYGDINFIKEIKEPKQQELM